jgi:hypothetical protein
MNRIDKNIIGKKFGKLTVLNFDGYKREPSGHRRMWVSASCECGNITKIDLTKLKMGYPKSCKKCCHAHSHGVKPGDRFNKLVVLGYERLQHSKQSYIKLLCDCGNTVHKRIGQLKKNITNSCGCSHNGHWGGEGEISRTFFYRIKRNAKVRGMTVNVTISQLWELYKNQKGLCALSGLLIEFNKKTAKASSASLDRIDSSKGYDIDNLQWVHKDINLMKMDFSQDKFLELCKKIITHKGMA